MTSVDYSIVRFSPVPEEVEAVNVAVLLWDRPPRLLFDSDFPRLAAITSRFDRTLLRAYLTPLGPAWRRAALRQGATLRPVRSGQTYPWPPRPSRRIEAPDAPVVPRGAAPAHEVGAALGVHVVP